MKKGITAYVWSYNEEKRLPITLKALEGFDEIIVLDKSSTDRSREIADEFGCKVYKLDYFDSFAETDAAKAVQEIWNSCENDWMFEVTCSDVYHPQLYAWMSKIINEEEDLEAAYIPLYRYSMGFVSKYSTYGAISYQAKLFKKQSFDWTITNLHANPLANAKRITYLKPDDPKVAIYHLTHENLEMVMERHLRYARVEAVADHKIGTREEYLERSWRSVLRVVKNYIKLRTFKLGNKGRAQLCMLLMYRCANFLNLYLDADEEKNIHEIYEKIRNGDFG